MLRRETRSTAGSTWSSCCWFRSKSLFILSYTVHFSHLLVSSSPLLFSIPILVLLLYLFLSSLSHFSVNTTLYLFMFVDLFSPLVLFCLHAPLNLLRILMMVMHISSSTTLCFFLIFLHLPSSPYPFTLSSPYLHFSPLLLHILLLLFFILSPSFVQIPTNNTNRHVCRIGCWFTTRYRNRK